MGHWPDTWVTWASYFCVSRLCFPLGALWNRSRLHAVPLWWGCALSEAFHNSTDSSQHLSINFGREIKREQGYLTAIINKWKRRRFLKRDKCSWKKSSASSYLLLELAVLWLLGQKSSKFLSDPSWYYMLLTLAGDKNGQHLAGLELVFLSGAVAFPLSGWRVWFVCSHARAIAAACQFPLALQHTGKL